MNNAMAWRTSMDRRVAAADALKGATLSQMLAIMELDHPAKTRIPLKDGFDATYRLGFIDGYEHFLSMFRSLGDNPPSPPKHIQSTFGSESPEQ